jgi:hypothetical protein
MRRYLVTFMKRQLGEGFSVNAVEKVGDKLSSNF